MTDLRYALRMLVKRPGGTLVAVASLALVIGTLTLALGAMQFERSRWMPFPEPERFVRFWSFGPSGSGDNFPSGVYVETERDLRGLDAIAGVGGLGSEIMTGAGEPRSLSVHHVTASAFRVADVPPLLGRTFTEEEQAAGREDLVVLGYRAWQEHFQGDPSVIGRVVGLNNVPCTIIGVMPEGFDRNALFFGLDAWMLKDWRSPAHAKHWIQIVGRRKADVAAAQLDAEVGTAMPRMLDTARQKLGWPAQEGAVRTLPLDKRPGGVEIAAVITGVTIALFVVGIAVFNVANILLGRMLARRHEFAVRFALGAGRVRVVRQLLTESVLLACLGAGAGLLGAFWLAKGLGTHGIEAKFDSLVLGVTAAATVVIGLAVGWLPAWRATRGDLVLDLKESGGHVGGSARHRLRNLLVIGQVAMATALCISAGLLVRSHVNRQAYDPGFDTRRFVTISATLNHKIHTEPDQRLAYRRQALENLCALPGVEAVALSSDRVVERYPFPTSFRLDGQDSWTKGQSVRLTILSPNLLPLVNVPVLRGRGLGDDDRRGSPPVAVVNQSFVKRYLPETDPVGARFGVSLESEMEWLTIVGVVPDRRNVGRNEILGPEAYLCAHQFAPVWSSTVFLVQTQPDPALLRDSLRGAVQAVDANVPVGSPQGLESQIERAASRNIESLRVIGVLGLFGLIMASIGIYGVVAYSVTDRTRELGVRMALGATRGDALALILRQGLRHVVMGLLLGGLFSLGMTFGMRELLYGTTPFDAATYSLVALVVFASSLVATLLPARRLLHINPVEALRHE